MGSHFVGAKNDYPLCYTRQNLTNLTNLWRENDNVATRMGSHFVGAKNDYPQC